MMAAQPALLALRLSSAEEGARHLMRRSNAASRPHALRRALSRGSRVSASYSTHHPAASVQPPPLDLVQLTPATLTEVLRRKRDIL